MCQPNHTHSNLIKSDNALSALFSGKAIFTLRSIKTGERFTYKIAVPNDKNKRYKYHASLLTGPDNTKDYSYLGQFTINDSGILEYRHSDRVKTTMKAPSVVALMWVMGKLVNSVNIDEKVEIWHEGNCLRCGKRLTDPESIASGYGKDCREIIKNSRKDQFIITTSGVREYVR